MNETAENKIMFSDILGSIVSSVSNARQIADIASINLAYIYQRNELLRGMAVPRLRFKTVKIDIPVLIHNVKRGVAPELDDAFNIALNVTNDLERRLKLAIDKLDFDLQADSLSQESEILMRAMKALWESVIEETYKQLMLLTYQWLMARRQLPKYSAICLLLFQPVISFRFWAQAGLAAWWWQMWRQLQPTLSKIPQVL